MNLRRRLLAAQAPLVVALALIVVGVAYTAVQLGSTPNQILFQNFRSFDAGRSMLQKIEVIDYRVLSTVLKDELFGKGDFEQEVAGVERELLLQERNITEKGEREVTDELRRVWTTYRNGLSRIDAANLAAHGRKSRDLRNAIEQVIRMNRAAMQQKSERARAQAHRIGAGLAIASIAAFALALVLSGVWIQRILAPIRVLERAVHRMVDGDFAARIRVKGNDEVALLSNSFNEMAARLENYKLSSLGELLEVNGRLESVMDSLADAVVVYDLDGTPLATNRVATRLVGLDRPSLDLLPEGLAEAVRSAFDAVHQSGEAFEPSSFEAAVEVAGVPSPQWLLVSATPVRTGGVLSGVTVALRDVTRFHRIEGFKGDLVAAAAHELRTPLTSLHMAVHLCLEQAAGPLSDRQQDLLVAARQDCERLQSVVEELLEMARLESGTAELVRTKVLVGDLLRDARTRHQVQAADQGKRIEIEPGDSLLSVHGDGVRLQRVLDNLVENALLHGRDRGRVVLGFERDQDLVRFHVDDDGPGVPPDLRARVFKKFFRVPGTAKRGSGLGLSIVEDIVSAHGGQVGVEGSPWGGARFWFTIPVESSLV